jgi:hypothetical protein
VCVLLGASYDHLVCSLCNAYQLKYYCVHQFSVLVCVGCDVVDVHALTLYIILVLVLVLVLGIFVQGCYLRHEFGVWSLIGYHPMSSCLVHWFQCS